MALRLQPLVRPTCRALAAAAQQQPPPTTTTTTLLARLPPARGPAAFPAQIVRQKRTMTRAEEEDLQGIPVRLLRDIKGFGRRHAIIRVKPGRMRNVWHHKGQAEYMTKQRFAELGLTEAAIGVRDRSFGTQLLLADDDDAAAAEKRAKKLVEVGGATPNKKKESVTFNATESRALLDDLLPQVLTFVRKPIATPEPAAPAAPAAPRSPALAANAITSSEARGGAPEPADAPAPAATPAIFGSVAAPDVLAAVRDALLADQHGNRVALEAEGIALRGLAPGEDRIKHLGRYEVDILTGKGVDPVRRLVDVVAPEDPKAGAQ